MKFLSALWAVTVLTLPLMANAQHGSVANATREAFSQPLPGLSDSERATFFRGRAIFQQSWIIAPAGDGDNDGLGPLFNRLACVSCHAKNGRGIAPDSAEQRLLSMLVRLSVAGTTRNGAPMPHPVYGDQLNEDAIPGVAAEGRASLHWQEHSTTLADGTVVRLRKPAITFSELAYGPLDGVMASARVGPPVFGLGLLQAVPVEQLQRIAAETKADGVSGSLNTVWDITSYSKATGRFGFKAGTASLSEQIAIAMLSDIGITSPLLPQPNCSPAQKACLASPHGGEPELSDARLRDLEFYLQHLAAPARRNTQDLNVVRGEQLFAASGCAVCHRPMLHTATEGVPRALAGLAIQPYTDLLLHDMGEGLADGRPEFAASGSQWRTTPLWGIGLTELISESSQYLHDGRARSLTEAILWHGGEAQAARDRFAVLNATDRATLLAFLQSL